MEIYRTVVGNNSPDLDITVKRNSVVIDLTDATSVTLVIKNERTGDQTNSGNTNCTIDTPKTNGIITYSPSSNDFPAEGRFIGTVKCVFPGAKNENIPDRILIVAEAV